MTPVEKQKFVDDFLSRYLALGFGGMPKAEIDLLIFHLLTGTSEYQNKSNYELSTLLQIPETRIKTFRLNSALKYRMINSKEILSKIVQRFINSEQFTTLESQKFEISLEDPIEKRELENFLKARGHHAEYTLNTEVLRISPVRLFELIVENTPNPKEKFNQLVQQHIDETAELEKVLDDSLTLYQKFSNFRKQHINMETISSLISSAALALT